MASDEVLIRSPAPSREALAHARRFLRRGWMAAQDPKTKEGAWQRELARAGYLRKVRSEWHFTQAGEHALRGD